MECLKVQFWVLYYLIYFYVICSLWVVDNIDIASYADDNTPYSVGKSQCDLERKLQKVSVKLFKCFYENGFKANQDKCDSLSSLDINTTFSLPACIIES